MAEANATAGLSRPGSFSAARLCFGSAGFCGRGRRPGRGRDLLLDLADQILQVVGLAGQLDGLAALGFERLFGVGLFTLALLNEHGHPCSFLRKCGEITTERLAFGRYFAADPHKFGKIGDQRIDLGLHVGQHGAQQNGSAHRLQRIFRADQQGGRRVAAKSLQRRKHFGDHGAAAAERAADRVLVAGQAVQPLFGRRDAVLHGTDVGRGTEDQLIELAAVLADGIDLGLELGREVGRPLLLSLNLTEFLLARALGGFGRDRDAGHLGEGGQAGDEQQERSAGEQPGGRVESGPKGSSRQHSPRSLRNH